MVHLRFEIDDAEDVIKMGLRDNKGSYDREVHYNISKCKSREEYKWVI